MKPLTTLLEVSLQIKPTKNENEFKVVHHRQVIGYLYQVTHYKKIRFELDTTRYCDETKYKTIEEAAVALAKYLIRF